VKIWDATANPEARARPAPLPSPLTGGVGPDGRLAARWVDPRTLKILDAGGKERLTLALPGETRSGGPPRFSPDGRFIAAPGMGGAVIVWDVRTGAQILARQTPAGQFRVMGMAFSRDGRRLAVGGGDGVARAWEVETGDELAVSRGHTLAVIGFGAGAAGLLGSPQGPGPLLAASALFPGQTYGRPINAVAFSPDGRRLAVTVMSDVGRIWDCESGQIVCRFDLRNRRMNSLAFSPDGHRLAGAGPDPRGRIPVWDAASGQELLALKGHLGITSDVAFTPDGDRIVTVGYDKSVKIWDAHSGRELVTLDRHAAPVLSVLISEDGRRLLTLDTRGTALEWDGTPLEENAGRR
jgi:WD40 repeat protein